MGTFVALLHSIVIAPGRRVVMSELRDMAAGLGLGNPRTLAATGNLVVEADAGSATMLEQRLEAAFAHKFGKHVDILVRSGPDWVRLAAANPFPSEAETNPDRVGVRVMRKPAGQGAVAELARFASEGERIVAVDGDIWVSWQHEPGGTRLLGAMTTRRLGIGTSRNWNTVRRLAAMVGG